ncbi:AMP-binding protein [Hydrocarboniphaga effusa]|uniref:AMP-binding protein n=1 Tax=Hydrocarboniphaga effusa TaxID=243629 RepID=UPI003137EDF5
MTHPWIASYPPGVPATIDPNAYSSVVALLEESFARYSERKAYACMGKELRYADVDRLSRALAAWLQSRGLAQGDRVAVMMPNILQYPVTVAAVLRAGCVLVNVNPLYTARELAHQLKDSGARAIVMFDRHLATLESIVGETQIEHVLLASLSDTLAGSPERAAAGLQDGRTTRFDQALGDGAGLAFRAPAIDAADIALLQYTGGTTGVSKGAVLLHETIVANLLASEAWMQPGLHRRPITGQYTILCALPLYHVFAFISCGLLGARIGAVNILLPDPRNIAAVVDAFKQYRIHKFPAVNTLFAALLHQPEFLRCDFSELCLSNGGGSAVQEAVARRWLAITGCPIVEGYGLSETSSGVTCNRTDSEVFTGNIGLPMPSVEIRILDDDGKALPAGASGEIAVRGPQVMAGYWLRPDETVKVMTDDGFLRTGDIGVIDEQGYIKLIDRKKDMIIVSGFNVFPNEIEAVVAGHPGVLECAVIGVADERTGEAVRLFVVRRDAGLSAADLLAFCSERLTAYKRPKSIEFIDALPKSNVGKILRKDLRASAPAAQAAP